MVVIPLPRGVSSKVTVAARLKNELAYNDTGVHNFSHYGMWTSLFLEQIA